MSKLQSDNDHAQRLVALQHRVEVAAGRQPADLLLKNVKIVDVGTAQIREGSIAVADGRIVGFEACAAKKVVDCEGLYALPGLIDGHIHIESSMVTPEELSRLLVPHGTTTIIADPHEIVNVAGLDGMNYMLEAASKAALHIEYMLPSCVPATPFEHAGAVLDAQALREPLQDERIRGLGEFMNAVGVVKADRDCLEKIVTAQEAGKQIDGHSPGLTGGALSAYAGAGVSNDHECSTCAEMEERLFNGMYILLRHGSACHNLEDLLPAVTTANSRRCLLCSDDRQAHTILTEGHVEDLLRRCVAFGIDPVIAVQMATLNAAEAFGLSDRGALFPGRRADITLVEDLTSFHVRRVYIDGVETAREGRYLPAVERADITPVRGRFFVKAFSEEKLKLPLRSDRVRVIEILPGGVVTGKRTASVKRDKHGNFLPQANEDIVKLAVVERHRNTGNVACALLAGYGLKRGAVAVSIAHDSHNIIVAGRNDADMALAVRTLIEQEGGIVLIKEGRVLGTMPLPVGGIMSDQPGEWVSERLAQLHDLAIRELGVNSKIDPIMTLSFMALPVIPELKLTDMGLFDVERFQFVPVEAEEE
uniref:adenine deaminase n=1 Tax=Ndongobacter massiliensis TaxID=1871025 RepID=UPI0009319B33|nr:adenine deaminase [Ndongobacter massiliensis]